MLSFKKIIFSICLFINFSVFCPFDAECEVGFTGTGEDRYISILSMWLTTSDGAPLGERIDLSNVRFICLDCSYPPCSVPGIALSILKEESFLTDLINYLKLIRVKEIAGYEEGIPTNLVYRFSEELSDFLAGLSSTSELSPVPAGDLVFLQENYLETNFAASRFLRLPPVSSFSAPTAPLSLAPLSLTVVFPSMPCPDDSGCHASRCMKGGVHGGDTPRPSFELLKKAGE